MEISYFFAQFWGALLLIKSLVFIFINEKSLKNIFKLNEDRTFSILSSWTALIIGLVTVILHNIWSNDWAIIITILGWLTFIQSIVRMILPLPIKNIISFLKGKMLLMRIIFIMTALLGLALIYQGLHIDLFGSDSYYPALQVTNFEECVKAGYQVRESHPRRCYTFDGHYFIERVTPIILESSITVLGVITCLPKISDGPQTLECAIGLRGENGNYYGLRNTEKVDPVGQFLTGEIPLKVSGTLYQEIIKGPDGNQYDVVGVIDVQAIEKVIRE